MPLRNGGYCRGVAARMNGKGIAFGYFFGLRIKKKEDATIDATLRPTNAIVLSMFGDLGLLKGEWPVVGRIEPWIKADWPLPPLYRTDALGQAGYISYCDDKLNFAKEQMVKIGEIDTKKFSKDSVWGYGAAEIHLTRLTV